MPTKKHLIAPDRIRAVIEARHGGADRMTDQQIMDLWSSIPHETQTRYLGEIRPQPEKESHAPDKRPATDI